MSTTSDVFAIGDRVEYVYLPWKGTVTKLLPRKNKSGDPTKNWYLVKWDRPCPRPEQDKMPSYNLKRSK